MRTRISCRDDGVRTPLRGFRGSTRRLRRQLSIQLKGGRSLAQLIDISQPLSGTTAAWPGDQPFELEWTLRRDRGASVNVAAIRMSVHDGTHVDGPMHVASGRAVGDLDLEPFVGPVMVVDARPSLAVEPSAVQPSALDGVDPAVTPRVLFRTREAVDPGSFPETFAALSPELARLLVARGFTLVGTDAPSIDPVDSTRLEAHRILAEAGVVNLENVVLTGVEPGRYRLIALPLRLTEADSSPVRAVLVSGSPAGPAGGGRPPWS